MLSLLALVLSVAAYSGEIQVIVAAPMVVSVDGLVRQPLPGSAQVTAPNLAAGAHLVEVKTPLGKPIAEMTLTVAVGQQVRLRYARQSFIELGRGVLPTDACVPVVEVVPLRPRPVAAPVQPMPEPGLKRLVSSLDEASFSSDQLAILHTAASRNHFTCAQVVRLLAPVSHSSDKVEAARLLSTAVLDPENAFVLNQAFSFSNDRELVQAMFE